MTYRTPAARPLPTYVLRASASVTVTLLSVALPTLLLGLFFSLDDFARGAAVADAGARVIVAVMCLLLLGVVVGVAIERWPARVLLTRDGSTIVIEWRRGFRVVAAARVPQADIVDVSLEMRSTTVDAAGDCDLVLCTRNARVPLRYHASAASCEAKSKELRAFLWDS